MIVYDRDTKRMNKKYQDAGRRALKDLGKLKQES